MNITVKVGSAWEHPLGESLDHFVIYITQLESGETSTYIDDCGTMKMRAALKVLSPIAVHEENVFLSSLNVRPNPNSVAHHNTACRAKRSGRTMAERD